MEGTRVVLGSPMMGRQVNGVLGVPMMDRQANGVLLLGAGDLPFQLRRPQTHQLDLQRVAEGSPFSVDQALSSHQQIQLEGE
jgi:hypothetical protein